MKRKPAMLLTGFVLAAALVVLPPWRHGPPAAPVTVSFAGFLTHPGIAGARQPQDPWGRFVISNLTAKPVRWSATTEAPRDPGLHWAWGYVSASPGGTLGPFASREYSWPVPGQRGQEFRAAVSCAVEVPLRVRLWYGFWRRAPLIARLWQPPPLITPTITAHSAWQTVQNAPSDLSDLPRVDSERSR